MTFEDSALVNNPVIPTQSAPAAASSDSSTKTENAQIVSVTHTTKKKHKLAKDSVALKAKLDSLALVKHKADNLAHAVEAKTIALPNTPPFLLDPNREGSYTAYFSMKMPEAAPKARSFTSDDLRQSSSLPQKATNIAAVKTIVKSDLPSSVSVAQKTSKDSTKTIAKDTVNKVVSVPQKQIVAAPAKTHTSTAQAYIPRAFRTAWGNTDWMLWYIIASFILFIIARFTYKKYLQQIFIALANTHVTNRLYRERNSLTSRVSFYLNILFCFNLALFTYQIINYFSISIFGINGFFISILFGFFYVLLYVGKLISLKIVGFLFNQNDLIEEYTHTVFLFNKIVGLILFPVIIMMPYLKNQYINETHIIGFGLFIIIAAYVLRLLRGIVLSLRQNASILYTFLYLCILEFVPLILLLKAILVVAKYL